MLSAWCFGQMLLVYIPIFRIISVGLITVTKIVRLFHLYLCIFIGDNRLIIMYNRYNHLNMFNLFAVLPCRQGSQTRLSVIF